MCSNLLVMIQGFWIVFVLCAKSKFVHYWIPLDALKQIHQHKLSLSLSEIKKTHPSIWDKYHQSDGIYRFHILIISFCRFESFSYKYFQAIWDSRNATNWSKSLFKCTIFLLLLLLHPPHVWFNAYVNFHL